MTTEIIMNEEQLIRHAINILIDSLGIVETTRFLTIKQQSRLESVARHELWQSRLEKEKFFDDIFTTSKLE